MNKHISHGNFKSHTARTVCMLSCVKLHEKENFSFGIFGMKKTTLVLMLFAVWDHSELRKKRANELRSCYNLIINCNCSLKTRHRPPTTVHFAFFHASGLSHSRFRMPLCSWFLRQTFIQAFAIRVGKRQNDCVTKARFQPVFRTESQ